MQTSESSYQQRQWITNPACFSRMHTSWYFMSVQAFAGSRGLQWRIQCTLFWVWNFYKCLPTPTVNHITCWVNTLHECPGKVKAKRSDTNLHKEQSPAVRPSLISRQHRYAMSIYTVCSPTGNSSNNSAVMQFKLVQHAYSLHNVQDLTKGLD